jgi:PKD repeat protein
MKNLVMTAMLILAVFGLSHAQAPTTVFGNVINANGSPVSNWPVFDLNDTSSLVYTDMSGTFSLPVFINPNNPFALIATFDCNLNIITQPWDPNLPGIELLFVLCDSNAQSSNCYADMSYAQVANLTMQYYGYGYTLNGVLGQYTYQWDFGDGSTGTGDITNHTYTAPGFYNVTLVAASTNCSESISYLVEVLDVGPTKIVNVSGTVLNSANQAPIAGWWVNGEGLFPSTPQYGATNQDGYYSFDLLVSDTASTVTVSTYDLCTFTPTTVTVPAISGIAGWTAQADFLICYDSIIFPPGGGCQAYISYTPLDSFAYEFSAFDWVGNPVQTYLWDFGDGQTSTSPNPVHIYQQEGIYTVTLNGTTADSCQIYACEIVCVFPNGGGVPIDTFYYGCQAFFTAYPSGIVPDFLTFQFESFSFGQVSSYFWDFGDGTTSIEFSPVHVYNTSGTYTVTLTIETIDGCESTIAMQIVAGNVPGNQWDCQAMFMPLPVPDSISIDLSFVFIDMSTSPTQVVSWAWNFGDGTTSTEAFPFHTYATAGIYTVSLTITTLDGCSSVFNLILDTSDPLRNLTNSPLGTLGLNGNTSSTQNPVAFDQVSLYPNPVSTTAVATFQTQQATDITYSIIDLTGRLISAKTLRSVPGANATEIAVATLQPGMYLLRMQSEGDVQTLKFVKE